LRRNSTVTYQISKLSIRTSSL